MILFSVLSKKKQIGRSSKRCIYNTMASTYHTANANDLTPNGYSNVDDGNHLTVNSVRNEEFFNALLDNGCDSFNVKINNATNQGFIEQPDKSDYSSSDDGKQKMNARYSVKPYNAGRFNLTTRSKFNRFSRGRGFAPRNHFGRTVRVDDSNGIRICNDYNMKFGCNWGTKCIYSH